MFRRSHMAEGFTLVELMVVVLILGILVAVAIPVFQKTKSRAQLHACFANQRTIEGAINIWSADHVEGIGALVGAINGAHPLIRAHIMDPPPTCPVAPDPSDRENPSLAEGAYTIRADGTVEPCTFAGHGHF